MKESTGVSKMFRVLKKNLRVLRSGTIDSIKKIEATAKKSGDDPVVKLSKQERKNLQARITEINTLADSLQKDLIAEVKGNTSKLKAEIENLNRLKDAADSNSYLLEYKKKDLLLKTQEIENAYDEISAKNKELLASNRSTGGRVENCQRRIRKENRVTARSIRLPA